MDKIFYKNLIKHPTKRKALGKFFLVVLLFVGYFIFITKKYGIEQGFSVTILTWSFFVLGTPIADAGFLIDFPLRLLANIRMVYSEIIVWIVAISLNIFNFYFNGEIYEKTQLLRLLKHVLEQPFPFWLIIFISALGTFISIKFGDELLDKINHSERTLYKKHRKKYYWVFIIFSLVSVFVLYNFLLNKMGLNF